MKTKLDFKNSAEKAELKIYDYIEKDWGFDTNILETQLQEANGKPLDIYINSYGGEVFEGFAIYNILKRYTGYKTVFIDGIAASIASLIALAGDKLIMPETSLFMIHNASGCCFGTADEMEKMAATLRQINQVLVDVYVQKTGCTVQQIEEFMNQEKFFNAKECLELGFADEIREAEPEEEKQTMTALDLLKKSLEDRITILNQMKQTKEILDQRNIMNSVKQEENQEDPKVSEFCFENKAIVAWLKGEIQ